MKYIKNHKFTCVVILIFIALVIVMYVLYNLFFINSSKPEYGNRLEGIEAVEIKNDTLKKVENDIKAKKGVKDVSTNITGRTLDIVVTVEDNMSLKDAKSIGNTSYKSLNEKQIKYYSIQIFVKKLDEAQNNFPIIGYKQKETTNVVWTKDRSVTKSNES